MSKISYSEYELQVLMAFHKKMEQREDAIISFVCFGHSKANWEEKTNYREPSLKEKYEKAFKTLVVKGDIYRLSEDDYACDYTEKELKQKIKECQKPQLPVADMMKIPTIKIEDIDQINAPTTSGIALKNKDSDDDDDDDLFLSSSDDDDDDLKDLPGVFSWKRETTEDVSKESTEDNVTEAGIIEGDESYKKETDKLLKEMKSEFSKVKNNESNESILISSVKNVNDVELEETCMDVIEAVVALDPNQDRYGAIEVSRRMLAKAQLRGNPIVVRIFERVHKEFEVASDEEYELLKKQIFE